MTKQNAGAGSTSAPRTTQKDTQLPVRVTRDEGDARTYVRRNAWNNGGTFANRDLLLYAEGVLVMMQRPLDDPTSWWFFAAIHGEDIDGRYRLPWKDIPAPPNVPLGPLPPDDIQEIYWNQCQHASWWFAPWHRGYLAALEAQIRQVVADMPGGKDWALPYWNYFGGHGQDHIPPAFTVPTLPDGRPNPLFVAARYGIKRDGNIYVDLTQVSQACQRETFFTNDYGGPETPHSGVNVVSLENNPHNLVHGEVGGTRGMMSSPPTAALDPIFYLHHANIDRMWGAWNAAGHLNPDDAKWLDGPAALGLNPFVMPRTDGTMWVFTPGEVTSLDRMGYTYDNLTLGVPTEPARNLLAKRLERLGATRPAAGLHASAGPSHADESELVGAHDGALAVGSEGARAMVHLDAKVRLKLTKSLSQASPTKAPDRAYLKLENVRGAQNAQTLAVYVNEHLAGTVSLFGVHEAGVEDGPHGGSGITFVMEITSIVDDLHLAGTLGVAPLNVKIVPRHALIPDANITVGRVSLYRKGSR